MDNDGLGDDDADLNEEQFLEKVWSLVVSHVSTAAHQDNSMSTRQLRGLLLKKPLLQNPWIDFSGIISFVFPFR